MDIPSNETIIINYMLFANIYTHDERVISQK